MRVVIPSVRAAVAELEQLKEERAALVRETSALEQRVERGSSVEDVDRLFEAIESSQRKLRAVDFHIKAATRRLETARATAPARRATRKELERVVRAARKTGLSIGPHFDAILAALAQLEKDERAIKALRAKLGLRGVESWAPLGIRLQERIRARVPVDIAAEDHFSDANMRIYLADDEDGEGDDEQRPAA